VDSPGEGFKTGALGLRHVVDVDIWRQNELAGVGNHEAALGHAARVLPEFGVIVEWEECKAHFEEHHAQRPHVRRAPGMGPWIAQQSAGEVELDVKDLYKLLA
jgi:hypothetical protein